MTFQCRSFTWWDILSSLISSWSHHTSCRPLWDP